MAQDAWINDLVNSLVKGHKLMDPSAWAPPNIFLLDPLFGDLWFKKIEQFKKLAEKNSLDYVTMANALPGPSCIRKEFRYVMWDMKLMGWPVDKMIKMATFYKNILQARAPSDPFNLHSALWHSERDLEKIVKTSDWREAGDELKKIVGKISGNCPPIAWGLFTDFFYHRAYEAFGIYKNINKFSSKLSTTDSIMIRQYGPFRAPEIWKHSAEFPINTVEIIGIYDNLDCDFDYINHFTTVSNIPQKLKYFCIKVDGKSIGDLSGLQAVNNDLMQMAVKQNEEYGKLDLEGQKKLTVLSKYYDWKELFALVGMDWRPNEEVLNRVVSRELLDIKFTKLSDKEKETFWRELFNPFEVFKTKEFVNAKKQVLERLEVFIL